MTSTRAVGARCEALAAEHLVRAGFRILARNIQLRYAELDLVALERDVLVVVEVRARRGDAFGSALESVDRRKRARLVRAASTLLASGDLPRHARVRFDVIAIDLSCDPPTLTHLRDAFSADPE